MSSKIQEKLSAEEIEDKYCLLRRKVEFYVCTYYGFRETIILHCIAILEDDI